MRILVTVTFNPNQLRAHLETIDDVPEVEAIVLVTDRRPPAIPKLRAVVPPVILRRLLGRALAKLIVSCILARRLRPDWIIGLNLVPHGLNAILASQLCRARSVYVMIGGPIEWEGGGWKSDNNVLGRLQRNSPLLEHMLLAAARRATVAVTMGSKSRAKLLERGFLPTRVIAIPASVDESRFHPRAVPPTWDAIAVAELIPRKRIADVVDAVARLAPERPQLRIAIAGTGPLFQELQDRARSLGVADQVDFLGFRDDVSDLYARSRVFVLPSLYEGLSISLLDAMASGLPVIVSDVGEARDVVQDGRNGFVYPVGRVDELARLLETLLDDPDLRKELGDNAARTATAHAGRVPIAAAYRELFTSGL